MRKIKTYEEFVELLKETRYLNYSEVDALGQDCVLDSDFDKKEILSYDDPYIANGAYHALEILLRNTLAQYKKESDKRKFVEDCLRDFGTNNIEYNTYNGNVTVCGKNYPMGTFQFMAPLILSNLFYSSSVKLGSIDAQVIAYLLGLGPQDGVINSNQRFDADNPLHHKLFRIVNDVVERAKHEGWNPPRWMTDVVVRWNRDTSYKTRLREDQQTALKYANDIKALVEIKSGRNVSGKTLSALSDSDLRHVDGGDLGHLDLPELHKFFLERAGYMSREQKSQILSMLIKRAPVDKEWYMIIGQIIQFKSVDHRLLFAFDKKFSPVVQSIKKELIESIADLESADLALEQCRTKLGEYQDKIMELKTKNVKNREYHDVIGDSMTKFNRLTYSNDSESVSRQEIEFYSYYYGLLDGIRRGDVKLNNANLEITGHPWRVFGTEKEKQRLVVAKALFAKLIELFQHPEPGFTDEDFRELEKTQRQLEHFKIFDMASAERAQQDAESRYSKAAEDKAFVDMVTTKIDSAKQEYRALIARVTEKLKLREEQQNRQPVIKSDRLY